MKRCLLHCMIPWMTASLLLVLTDAGASAFPLEGTEAVPKLKQLTPAGGQRGTRIETVCTGDFSWPVQVSAPGAEVEVGKEKGKLTISLPADLCTDRVWIRLFNSQGASSALPFLVGSCPEIQEAEPNNVSEEAQEIDLASQSLHAATINGVLHKRGEIDCFRVQLQDGATLVATVDANQRLGSPIDAIVQVVSPAGAVVAENHDALGLDPRLAVQATATGQYVVRVFAFAATPNTTIAYHGGDDCLYRLTLSTGPYIAHALPFAAAHNATQPLELIGWNIPAGTRLPMRVLGQAGSAQEFEPLSDARALPEDRLGFLYTPNMAGSARLRLTSSATDVTQASGLETPLPIPSVIAARIEQPGQTDTYRLELTKGLPLSILVEAQNLELPLVPSVQLTDPSGKVVVETPEGGTARDAVLTTTPAQDGEYELKISDRFARGGDWYYYRLTLRPQESNFELSLPADSLIVSSDKPAELTVDIKRHAGQGGAIGTIRIEAVDLPEGVTCQPVNSEASGDSAKKVKLTIVAEAKKAYSGPIRIRGISDPPRQLEHFARTPAQYQASFDAIWLTVVDPK